MQRASTRTDVELLAATPADADAFAEFYRRHERPVLGFFMHWCRSGELAADLMAETFAAAFESRSRYRADLGEPRVWLFGIARHVLLRSIRRGRVEDEIRRRLGIARLVIDDDALERVEMLACQPDAAVNALDGLSQALRDAVVGRVIDQREYAELAETLQCSKSVVRQRVARGLARIRNRLEVK